MDFFVVEIMPSKIPKLLKENFVFTYYPEKKKSKAKCISCEKEPYETWYRLERALRHLMSLSCACDPIVKTQAEA